MTAIAPLANSVSITPSGTTEEYSAVIEMAAAKANRVALQMLAYVQGSSSAVTVKIQGSFDKLTWEYLTKFDGSTAVSVAFSSAITAPATKTVYLYDDVDNQPIPVTYPFIRFGFTFATSHSGASAQYRPVVWTD